MLYSREPVELPMERLMERLVERPVEALHTEVASEQHVEPPEEVPSDRVERATTVARRGMSKRIALSYKKRKKKNKHKKKKKTKKKKHKHKQQKRRRRRSSGGNRRWTLSVGWLRASFILFVITSIRPMSRQLWAKLAHTRIASDVDRG